MASFYRSTLARFLGSALASISLAANALAPAVVYASPVKKTDRIESKKPLKSKGLPTIDTKHPIKVVIDKNMHAPKEVRMAILPDFSMQAGIKASELNEWQSDANSPDPKKRTEALRLLAEYDLGSQEPEAALAKLDKCLAEDPKSVPNLSVIKYDHAGAMFLRGRFEEASKEIKQVAKLGLPVVLLKDVPLELASFRAHYKYHYAHAALGIPQPPSLDPLCGAASLAAILKKFNLNCDKDTVVANTAHNGEGSDMVQIAQAATKLGLYTKGLRITDDGLKQLGIPIVARVEHDHFVAILGANDKGVTYSCSDCGEWPGGKITLKWPEWRALDADMFLAVAPLGSEDAAVLAAIPEEPDPLSALQANSTPTIPNAVTWARVKTLTKAVVGQYVTPRQCGTRPDVINCGCNGPTAVHAGSRHPFTPGDPMNPFSAEESWSPEVGLFIYNPHGKSFTFGPSYRSYDNPGPDGFGMSWYHNFSCKVISNVIQGAYPYQSGYLQDPNSPSLVVLPNGETLQFKVHGGTGGSTTDALIGPCTPTGHHLDFLATFTGTGYTVTMPDRSIWTFSGGVVVGGQFQLQSIQDAHGHSLIFNRSAYTFTTPDGYDEFSTPYDVTSVQNEYGQVLLNVNHDPTTSLITSIDDNRGRSIYYSYIRRARGASSTYATDSLYQISQVVPTGTTSPPVQYQFSYDEETWPDGTSSSINLPFLNSISVPSPTGTGLTTDTIGGSFTNQTGPDSEGNYTTYLSTTENSNPDNRQVQQYDSGHHLLSQYTEWVDNNMSLTKRQNAAGTTVATYTYGNAANPDKPTSIVVGSSTTTYTYDSLGNVLTVQSPAGVTTTYTYDYTAFALGQLTKVQVGSLSPTSYTYNSAGDVLTVVAPIPGNVGSTLNQTTTLTYNTNGDLLTVSAPGNGTVSAHTLTLTYGTDSNGPLAGQAITSTNTLGKVSSATYDSWARVLTSTDENSHVITYTYDIAGNVLSEAVPNTGNTGTGSETTTSSYLYTNGPTTQSSLYNESGTLSRQTTFTYGAEGELLNRSGEAESVSLTYDGAYRLKTLKDGNNNATTYYYDQDNNTTEIAYPGSTGSWPDTVTFSGYNSIGQPTGRTDGNNHGTTYGYNSLYEPTSVSYSARSGDNIGITYDSYGRQTLVTDGTGSIATTYDDLGNVNQSTRQFNAITSGGVPYNYYTTYTYNPDNSRATMANLVGTWTYSYDGNGRYTSLVGPAGTGTSFATYQDNGWQSSRTLPNGAVTFYTYNNAGLLAGLQNQTGTGGSVISKVYMGAGSYDDAFNLKKPYPTVTGVSSYTGNSTFSYDSKDRLTSEVSTKLSGYTNNFAYDTSGNPTTFKGATRAYNADNQLTRDTFDGNGNPTTYNGSSMTFDQENRALTFGSTATASYQADGLRASKNSIYYLYDQGEPVVELNASGGINAYNVFAPDGLVARGGGGTIVYYLFDQQGSVSERFNASQTILSHSTYDAYGGETSTSTPTDTFGFNARWGYVYDRDLGLYLCGQRYYDPGTSRWLTRDPGGFVGGLNLYGYCQDTPLNTIDSMGFMMTSLALSLADGDASDIWVDSRVATHWGDNLGACHALIVVTKNGLPSWQAQGGPGWRWGSIGQLIGDAGKSDPTEGLTPAAVHVGRRPGTPEDVAKGLVANKPAPVQYAVPGPGGSDDWSGTHGANSNTWVRKVLKNNGLPQKHPDQPFPLWDNDPWDHPQYVPWAWK